MSTEWSPFHGSVVVRQVGDVEWELVEPLGYTTEAERRVTVPVGWRTDLASVPCPFAWVVPRSGRYTPAAIVHDHLRSAEAPTELISYREADAEFRRGMRHLGVPVVHRWLMWTAVRWSALRQRGGRRGWWRDAPAILAWTLLALVVVVPPAIVVSVALLVLVLVEVVAWVPRRLFSRRRPVPPSFGTTT